MGELSYLTGMRFGKLLVLDRHPENTKENRAQWLCQCDCGAVTIVAGKSLRNGHTKSCGCFHKEAPVTHGLSKSPEYLAWCAARARCTNEKNPGYPDYGGRGITVSERWQNSFENFYADVGARPSPIHSLERKEVNGNYEPGNCEWALPVTQANNRRNNVTFIHNDQEKTLAELSRESGVSGKVIQYRLQEGKSLEEALSVPADDRCRRQFLHNGVLKSIPQISRETSIQPGTLRYRLVELGWTLEKALSESLRGK